MSIAHSDQSSSNLTESEQLNKKLRVLEAENARLRAAAAAALRREELAEDQVTLLEEKLLYLRRRSLHWYLSRVSRLLGIGDGRS